MEEKNFDKQPDPGTDAHASIRRKIRFGWIGLFTYLFVASNAIRFALDAPLAVMISGCILNLIIITFFVLHIRKDYKKLREGKDSAS